MSWVKAKSRHVNKRKNKKIEEEKLLVSFTLLPDGEIPDYLGFLYSLAKQV